MEISIRLMSNKGKAQNRGLELAICNRTKESRGAQIGAVNGAGESSYGAQIGAVNGAGESRGAQIGGINYAKNLHGIQFGVLLNICGKESRGVQIGALNWRTKNPWYSKAIPILALRTAGRKKLEEKIEG